MPTTSQQTKNASYAHVDNMKLVWTTCKPKVKDTTLILKNKKRAGQIVNKNKSYKHKQLYSTEFP